MSEPKWVPDYEELYWYRTSVSNKITFNIWENDEVNLKHLKEGNVHPTKEAAEAWGAAQGETK